MNKRLTWLTMLVRVALIASLLELAPASLRVAAAPLRAQPALLQLAAAQPDSLVAVIVQKATASGDAEALVARLGGSITKDLHIINAFAAQLPARQVTQLARAPTVRWVSLDAPVQNTGSESGFTTWATKLGSAVRTDFGDAADILSPVGADGTFGYGRNARGAFGGFAAEFTPGYSIGKVEVALRGYTPLKPRSQAKLGLTVYAGGVAGRTVSTNADIFSSYTDPANAGTLYLDITYSRAWLWSDFGNDLQLVIDQTNLGKNELIYYDAVGLRVTLTPNAPNAAPASGPIARPPIASPIGPDGFPPVDTSNLVNRFNQVVRATDVWNEAPDYVQGQGITVAIVDSGVIGSANFDQRLLGQVNFNPAYHDSSDRYGHGTFVAGIVADSGALSAGKYTGTAPQANIVSVRISDDQGMGTMSDIVNSLQWINDNKTALGIRVVNVSIASSVYESYLTNPLDAAVEILWFNGIVVVVSAGNNGTATLYPPANDPFVITVGATNDLGTASLDDDYVATFSAYGVDDLGGIKPDLVAPGANIIAYLPDNSNLTSSILHPQNRVDVNYFRMSGTSMSAPVVTGAVAMLLQSNPALTPDQVKYRLKATATTSWPGYDPARAGAGILDIYAAVHGATTESANLGQPASQLLWTGSDPINWGTVNWNAVNWNAVNWNAVNWNAVNWNAVNWNADYWEP